jgi:hypothetical protein
VTPAVYDGIKDKFLFKMRGSVEVQAKGEMMVYIVSGWMGMIKSRSIIPHPPTDHSPLPTDYHSGITGIDIIGWWLQNSY